MSPPKESVWGLVSAGGAQGTPGLVQDCTGVIAPTSPLPPSEDEEEDKKQLAAQLCRRVCKTI